MVTGSIETTLEGADFIATPGPPETYFGVAQSLLPGANVLASHTPQCSMALALVTSHVLECLLKASITRRQTDPHSKAAAEREVMEPNKRHNLEWLWVTAAQRGLPVNATPPDWALNLHRVHTGPDYFLRYSKGVHGMLLPAAQPMVADLAVITELVRTQLGQ
jgi:hypothetical protein